jgi:hypothetical protein
MADELKPLSIETDSRGMQRAAVDPNVVLPARVTAAVTQAEARHKQVYAQSTPSPAPQPVPQPQPPTPQPPAPQPVPQPQPTPPTPAPEPQPAADPRANWTPEQWAHHAKSMEGRYRQSQETITSLQSSLNEIGAELVQTQTSRQTVPPSAPSIPPRTPTPLLTPEDVSTYGEDLLNVAQRAALQAVSPKIAELEERNARLEHRIRRTALDSVNMSLDREVPNWLAINISPRFKAWLSLRDVYSGRIRKELLMDAHRAADAARVVSFFKGFLAEEEATGSTEFGPGMPPPLSAAPSPPALELSALAAPGHAKPAVGAQPNASASEPIWITRGQIKDFFANVRRGVYNGRQQDYLNDQAIIFECQRTGRIR